MKKKLKDKMKMIFEILDENGIGFLLKKIFYKILPDRISNFVYIQSLFKSKYGLEIGGPSRIFGSRGFVPLYKIVGALDGCNFSDTTIWEGNIKNEDKYNYYKNKEGVQYVSEATNLSIIPDSKYDFVISSNCLEHIANPLKAIEEWIRVVKNGGVFLIILPNKDFCFDHNRPITEFSHLLKDFQNNINEDDLTHLNEILELHDLKMDKAAGSLIEFRERSLNNFKNRALHQHVFNINLLKEIFSFLKLEILFTYEGQDVIIIGKKYVL
ncbi:MAG: class I SAM-dependent methyltransferase [Paludibacteraceae bacterium]|nr:class I SAM-dependent methyltransferase [Paludibacteraceae bacterium]